MKEGHDVFVPVFWVNHLEIMAYSVKGKTGIWHFPREWTGIEKVDIYTFNEDFTGLRLLEQGRKINKNQIYLSQEPDRAQIIVPAGTDMTDRSTIYSNPPSGTATFICKDVETHGNWKRKYGKKGYDIFGHSSKLPKTCMLSYIGDSLKVLDNNSTRPVSLQKVEGKGRIEAVRTSVLHQLIDVTVEENTKVSLYFADYKEKNCQEVVDVIDVNTKRMLASYLLNNFEEGVYLSFGVSGNVQFRITRFFYDHYGNPDYPVCSAIFFDKE